MEFIKLSLEEELAVVTIDRPKSLNALNSQVYREIIATLRQVEAMDQVKRWSSSPGQGRRPLPRGQTLPRWSTRTPWRAAACRGCAMRRQTCWSPYGR